MTIKEMRLAAGLRQQDILDGYEDKRLTRPDISKIEEGIVEAPQRLIEHVRNVCKGFINEDETEANMPCTHSQITLECRRESYLSLDNKAREAEIYRIFKMYGEMTAREVVNKLGKVDMNYARPRITELAQKGLLEECGKKKDPITGKTVTVWRAA